MVVRRELRSCTCSWGHDVWFTDRPHLLQQTFKEKLLRRNYPREEKGWKKIRKPVGWHSANTVQQMRKWRAYCDPCTATVFRVVTTTARILATIGKYFEENMQCLVWNKIRYLSFFNWRDITVIILIFGLNNGFRTFRRNHMFSVAMCIICTRALWLVRVFC